MTPTASNDSTATLGADTDTSLPSAENSGQSVAEAQAGNGAAGDLLGRVVQGAHDGIDRLAEAAAPTVQRLDEGASAMGSSLRDQTAKACEVGDEWIESLRTTVRQNPLAAIAAAAALGLLVARLTR